MRKIFYLVVIVFCLGNMKLDAQSLSGYYNVAGYFFHPTLPRAENLRKTLTQINDSTYQANVGDLDNSYNYYFQFMVNAANQLVNWRPIGSTPADTTSGFMTTDNPGGFSYYPDTTTGYTSDVYNNTYDPTTRTFYMHYGYSNTGSDTGQASYTRQIYEKWEYNGQISPFVTSFSPLSGTSGTVVTLQGKYFTNVGKVYFGNRLASDFTILSDTIISAVVGPGSTGEVEVFNTVNSSTSGDTTIFTYTPPIVTDTTWHAAGNRGFSAGAAAYVSLTRDTAGLPYVAYQDVANSNKATVMRLTTSDIWEPVGMPVSAGAASFTNLAIGSDNVPYIAYIDSSIANRGITVQKFSGNAWQNVGTMGFDTVKGYYATKVALALDNQNRPYVLTNRGSDSTYIFNVRYFDGSAWQYLGKDSLPFISALAIADMAIDKVTNAVYVTSDKKDSGYQATVAKYENGRWSTLGAVFTHNTRGVFYPNIAIASNGQPVTAYQDDDSREKISVYQFDGSAWHTEGMPYFTPGHCYYVSLALDGLNTPYVAYEDYSYNALGTVMKPSPANDGTWITVGARGFAQGQIFTRQALAYSRKGYLYLGFADTSAAGKVSVLRVAAPTASVLPLSLLSLNVTAQNHKANINWRTTNEVNTSYFTVQRSVDGIHFTNIGKVNAASTSGNHSYSYTDDLSLLSDASTVYYRLQITDKDGSSTGSKVVSVTVAADKLVTILPNPAHSFITVTSSAASNNITITDMSGRILLVKKNVGSTDRINISTLAKGVYSMRIDYTGGYAVRKFIVE